MSQRLHDLHPAGQSELDGIPYFNIYKKEIGDKYGVNPWGSFL